MTNMKRKQMRRQLNIDKLELDGPSCNLMRDSNVYVFGDIDDQNNI